jgi:hypothetical protein
MHKENDEHNGDLLKPDSVNRLGRVFFTWLGPLLRSGIMCVLIESKRVAAVGVCDGALPNMPAMVANVG